MPRSGRNAKQSAGSAGSWRASGAGGMKPGHCMSVDVLTVAKSVTSVSPFDLESEFAVEPQGRLIVGEDRQVEPFVIQPVVGQVKPGLHQGGADAFALPVVAHDHAQPGAVPSARLGGKCVQSEHPYRLGL